MNNCSHLLAIDPKGNFIEEKEELKKLMKKYPGLQPYNYCPLCGVSMIKEQD